MKQCLFIFFMFMLVFGLQSQDYEVGTFYMPFWGWEAKAHPNDGNWGIMKRFNDQSTNGRFGNHAHEKRIPIRYQSQYEYYNEMDPAVTSAQMRIMKDYGVDFVAFDSFWGWIPSVNKWLPYFKHVLENVRKDRVNFHGREFAIRWSNDFAKMVANTQDQLNDPGKRKANPEGCRGLFKSGGGLDQLIAYWKPLMQKSNYKRINGKPVIYMGLVEITAQTFYDAITGANLGKHTNTIEGLCGICGDDPFFNGMPASQRHEPYINWYKTNHFLKEFERRIGFDIYWVATFNPPHSMYENHNSSTINYDWLKNFPQRGGFDGLSAYTYKYYDKSDIYGNYRPEPDEHCRGNSYNKQWTHYDYNKMTSIYNEFWNFVKRNPPSGVKYHVPVTAGWNRASLHYHEGDICKKNNHKYHNYDQSFSTPSQFENHIRQARTFMDQNPSLTDRTTMVCCWNEYAEGAIIEPTVQFGYDYVNRIRRVFGTSSKTASTNVAEEVTVSELPETESLVQVYPNPMEDLMTVDLFLQEAGPMQIQVFDLSGKSVKALDLDLEQGRSSIQVNMFDLKPGIYNVEMVTEEGKTVKKISIQ